MPGIFEMVKDDLIFLRIDKLLPSRAGVQVLPNHDARIGTVMNVFGRFSLYLAITAILANMSVEQGSSVLLRTYHLQLLYPKHTATRCHSHSQISEKQGLLSVRSRCLLLVMVDESRPHHEESFHSKTM